MSFSRKSLFLLFRPLLWALSILFGLALVYHAGATPPHPVWGHKASAVKAQGRTAAAKHPSILPHAAEAGRAAPHASLPFILHSFDGTVNGGSNPDGGPLVYVPTLGLIYGTTTGAGAFTQNLTGTVFSLDPIANGTVTTLQTVQAFLNNGLALGYDASSTMMLYGTDVGTTAGSTFGEIFRVSPVANGTEATVRDFNDGTSPYPTYPQSGLVAARDGYLYGTTRYVSGTSSQTSHSGGGVLYRLLPSAPSATFEILHRFASDGSEGHPMKGALPLITSSGVIYGVNTTSSVAYNTSGSGGNDPGIGFLYKYDPGVSDPAQRFQIVKQLDPAVVGNFTYSQASLVQGSDGMLYGTSDRGGANGDGTLFRINPADNSVTLQYTFGQSQPGGGRPIAGLTIGADHNLYGVTTQGNDTTTFTVNSGSVFRLRPDGSGNYNQLDLLHQFAAYDDNDNAPEGICKDAMVEVNGILFGTCYSGGATNDGLIFQVDDGDSVPVAPAPTITAMTYHVHADGTSEVDVTGMNFVSTPTADITNTNEAGLTVTFNSATSLTLNLPRTVAAGDHTVTITNPDKQSAKATLTTLGAPAILTPSTAVTDTNGAVHLIVSGFNFAKPGYDGDPTGSIVVVQAIDAQGNASAVDTTIASGPDAPTGKTGPQQFIVTLNSTDAGSFTAYDHFVVEVFNADGQHSALPASAGAHTVKPHDSQPVAAPFLVFDQSQTKYHLYFDNGSSCSLLDTNLVGAQLAHATSLPCPTQLLLGNLSLLNQYPSANVSGQGVGTSVTGVISNDGGSLISQDGNGLVSNSSGTVVSNDGGSLIGQDGNGLIGEDGSSLIGQDGNGLVSNSSGTLVSNSSGTFVATSALVGDIQASASLNGNLHISGVISNDGGSIRSRAAGEPHASSTTALSFDFTRHDEGPTHGTGPMDATFTGTFAGGATELLLDIRFTPGQPDIVEYMAPGVTLTPTNGTPAPQINNPTPTLTSISPSSAIAGSGDTTITATGTLFTSGATVDFNGQALATTVISGTTLTAVVPAALLGAPGSASVTVVNPSPGGGVSNALTFTVNSATPPTTTATVTGPQNGSGAYTRPATVTLTAVAGSFPVATTTYSVDGGASQAYKAPFTVSTAGSHTITYFSTDTAGSVEAAKTLTLTIQPIAHTFPTGIQMLSVPADFAGVALGTALTPAPTHMLFWNPGAVQYVSADALHPGQGYWARFAQDTVLYDLGAPTPTGQPFGIALKRGWNMIGDPFPAPVSLGSAQVTSGGKAYASLSDASKAGVTAYTLYGYPAGADRYQIQGAGAPIQPYQGYWLYAFQDCTLQISAP